MNAHLSAIERLNGFTCYPGQREFILELARHESGIVAADCGAGKTCIALVLSQLLGARRTWIIAPKGTAIDESGNAQWVSEIRVFAPSMAVFELASMADHDRIAKANGGVLPEGLYVGYHEAAFVNGGIECPPKAWTDGDLASSLGRWSTDAGSCATIGLEHGGIRCIFRPCLATLIGHLFDMVVLDECHKVGPGTISHQMLRRLRPKYRWAFSATPMIDSPEDILPVLEWVENETTTKN